ncbi:MAG: 50S ribosomal protein L7/L12, partial [Planctomycetota bacterium]|nr:50S ribosomal protein L7/L12 [Planctomycetota bacterium]
MSAEAKNWDADVKNLGDQIVKLTVLQAKQLADYLKETYGIEPAGGVMVAAAAAAPAAAPAAAADEGPATFKVVLT